MESNTPTGNDASVSLRESLVTSVARASSFDVTSSLGLTSSSTVTSRATRRTHEPVSTIPELIARVFSKVAEPWASQGNGESQIKSHPAHTLDNATVPNLQLDVLSAEPELTSYIDNPQYVTSAEESQTDLVTVGGRQASTSFSDKVWEQRHSSFNEGTESVAPGSHSPGRTSALWDFFNAHTASVDDTTHRHSTEILREASSFTTDAVSSEIPERDMFQTARVSDVALRDAVKMSETVTQASELSEEGTGLSSSSSFTSLLHTVFSSEGEIENVSTVQPFITNTLANTTNTFTNSVLANTTNTVTNTVLANTTNTLTDTILTNSNTTLTNTILANITNTTLTNTILAKTNNTTLTNTILANTTNTLTNTILANTTNTTLSACEDFPNSTCLDLPPPPPPPGLYDVLLEGFDPQGGEDAAITAVKVTTLALLAVCGVLGNALVIWSVVKQRHLHRPPFYYLLSLSLTDLSRAAFCLPLVLMTLLQGSVWRHGDSACDLFAFANAFFVLSSGVSLLDVAADRHLSLLYSRSYRRRAGGALNLVVVLLGWSLAFLVAFPPVVGVGGYAFEASEGQCTLRHRFYRDDNDTLGFLLVFSVLALLTLFLYYRIFLALRAHRKMRPFDHEPARSATWTFVGPGANGQAFINWVNGFGGVSAGNVANLARNPPRANLARVVNLRVARNQHVTRLFFLMALTFHALWLPYQVLSYWRVFGTAADIGAGFATAAAWLSYGQVLVCPVVYFGSRSPARRRPSRADVSPGDKQEYLLESVHRKK